MMLDLNRELADAVSDGLRQSDVALTEMKRRRWKLHLAGLSKAATARLHAGWLQLELPVGRSRSRGRTTLDRVLARLQQSEGLPGRARLALDSRRLMTSLVCDVPVDEQPDLAARLNSATGDLHDAAKRIVANGNDEVSAAEAEVPAETAPLDQLASLCRESGWPPARETETELAIELDVPSAYFQARMARRRGGAAVWVNALDEPNAADACRLASSLLMLSACRELRLAGASLCEVEGNSRYRWRVGWSNEPTAEELGHAFSALSVACHTTGRELEALQEESIARAFLAVRGWSL